VNRIDERGLFLARPLAADLDERPRHGVPFRIGRAMLSARDRVMHPISLPSAHRLRAFSALQVAHKHAHGSRPPGVVPRFLFQAEVASTSIRRPAGRPVLIAQPEVRPKFQLLLARYNWCTRRELST
jgi:hypothetical protein